MTLFILAYLAGVLTVATPCILPVLPFVLTRVDRPFTRGALPMLVGMAFAFAATASLAAVAGGWAVQASSHGRNAALAIMTLFGLTMLVPTLASRLTAPIVSIGSALSDRVGYRSKAADVTVGSSMLLGVATGLVWAPCAGPVLGFILAGAAIRGPGVETYLLLLIYASGASTALAVGMLFGRRLSQTLVHSARWGNYLRRILGAAAVAGAATIWLGLDTGLLTRLSVAGTDFVEQRLVDAVRTTDESKTVIVEHTPASTLSSPLTTILSAADWVNTERLRAEDVRGKAVIVNFWTYSCINCLRLLPHVQTWAEKYRAAGLIVIGVHTPEFAFEKDTANLRMAMTSLHVDYPVVMDNDFRIWRAFSNQYWPALYFFDQGGRLRHRVFGERSQKESEDLIRKILSEVDGTPKPEGVASVAATGIQAPADIRNLRSSEAYIGYNRATNFASYGGIKKDVPSVYRSSPSLRLNHWGLTGVWTIGGEFAALNDGPGTISHRFHARDLHLVLALATKGRPVRFRVRIDGIPPGADHGSDVDADGWGTVQEGRLYQLVRQAGQVVDRTFEIEFFDAGVRAYAFTFG